MKEALRTEMFSLSSLLAFHAAQVKNVHVKTNSTDCVHCFH